MALRAFSMPVRTLSTALACLVLLMSGPAHLANAREEEPAAAAATNSTPSTANVAKLTAAAQGGGSSSLNADSDPGLGVGETSGAAFTNGRALATVASSTGLATASLAFTLNSVRGGLQPLIGLGYMQTNGDGFAGTGWTLTTPSIERKNASGTPLYVDPPANGSLDTTKPYDDFVMGGSRLIPICAVLPGNCSREQMPAWTGPGTAGGGVWLYFRRQVDTDFDRFFWSPDRRTWVVQKKSGELLVFGVPFDGTSTDVGGIDTDSRAKNAVFRWNLVRQFDNLRQFDDWASLWSSFPADGYRINAIVYKWKPGQLDGIGYLTDAYDTPIGSGNSFDTTTAAHHVHLAYSLPGYAGGAIGVAPRPVPWRARPREVLSGVDLTSKGNDDSSAPRKLVRRYHLGYTEILHHSYLSSFQVEGQCGAFVEDSNANLPAVTGCTKLPETRITYQPTTSAPYVHVMTGTPTPSQTASLIDFNSDGMPDVIAKDSAGFQHLFLNSAGATADELKEAPTGATFKGADFRALGSAWTLGDWTGSGKLTALNRISGSQDYVLRDIRHTDVWDWGFDPSPAGSFLGPNNYAQIPNDPPRQTAVDVDGDGLIDLVTFDPFGANVVTNLTSKDRTGKITPFSASSAGMTRYNATCAPTRHDSAGKIDKTATPTFVADMNADGLPDLASVRNGDVAYWAGNGDGSFGSGTGCPYPYPSQPSVCDCSHDHYTTIAGSPTYASTDRTYLHDLNGDGYADLIVAGTNITVWWNDRTTFSATPTITTGASIPGWAAQQVGIYFADMNANGVDDLVLVGANNYARYIEFEDNGKPGTLLSISNGLGLQTQLTYASMAELARKARTTGDVWNSQPQALHVVTRVQSTTHLAFQASSDIQYAYSGPVYDARERAFRGFRSVTATRAGTGPTDPGAISRTTYLIALCPQDAPQPCLTADEPLAGVHGLPIFAEAFDANGVYSSEATTTYRLQRHLTGLDGRIIRSVSPQQVDTYLYDNAPFTAGSVPIVSTTLVDDNLTLTSSATVTLHGDPSAGRKHLRVQYQRDSAGNLADVLNFGSVEGTADPAIEQSTHWTQVSPWRWRADTLIEGYSNGTVGGFAPDARTYTVLYDPSGKPTRIKGVSRNVGQLSRRHESGQPVAPTSTMAEVEGGLVDLAWFEYDLYGNIKKIYSPSVHCQGFDYDKAYGHLLASATVYNGNVRYSGTGICGTVALTSLQSVDRPSERVTMTLSPANEMTSATYDGFGRLLTTNKPSATLPGRSSTETTMSIQYFDVQDGPTQRALVKVRDTAIATGLRSAWTYADGLGRVVLALNAADKTANDPEDWVVSGQAKLGSSGAPLVVYRPRFWSGDGAAFPFATAGLTTVARTYSYDAFGRLNQTKGPDGGVLEKLAFHALSSDNWDAADLESGGTHGGTYVTHESDGHGRPTSVTRRIHPANALTIDAITTAASYLATGEIASIVQTHSAGPDKFARSMTYDSFGHMTANFEPNTSNGLNSWRYVYDNAGQLVGTSDARGCGRNFDYDPAGRIVSEDFSPCLTAQALYTPPAAAGDGGYEIRYTYDAPEAGQKGNAVYYQGRLVAMLDRGAHTRFEYDGRGHVAAVERQLAKPDALTSAGVPSTYAPHWFRTESTFDDAERLVRMTTGADVTELYGSRDTDTNPLTTANGQSVIKMTYSVRGFIKTVGGSYGSILASASNDEVGLPLTQKYGDPAGTTSSAHYDAMNRLANITLSRQAPAFWSQVVGGYTPPTGGPSNLQTVLENTTYHYDLAGNPTQIDDGRDPSLWPAGAKPTSKTITYDDFYRVTHISYRNNNDSYVSPNAHEVNAGDHKIPAFKQANFAQRVQEQGFSFDWLGNTTSATDDTNSAFFDRSIGGINNGGAGGVAGPHQLGNAVGQDGNVAVTYDAAGNLATMNVAKVCAGGGLALLALAPKALSASVRTSSPSTSIVRPPPPPPPPPPPTFCVTKFAYEWDEVGQLARARRWDPGSGVADYDFSYVYDGNGARTVTAATDSVRPTERQYRADVFQTLRLDGAAWDATSGDYTRTAITEAVYFGAGGSVARLKYASEALPSQSRAHLHVFLEFSDKLGSTGSVVDLETSELVEAGTYLPFGDAETDYRTDRWSSFREEERFVGKVEDREVGLTYFGGRYYSATLGRWMSADPIAVHQAAGDLNPYAYVAGRLSTLADPSGLGPQDDEVPDPKTGVVSGYVEGVGYCMGKECLAPQFANATFDFTTLYDAAAAGNSTTAVSAPHPPPMAPVTSVADTNAEEGATLETLKTGAAGLLFGMGQGGTPGGMLTTAVNLPDGPRNNATFRYWQGAGQIIGGVISVVNGAGAVTGGAGVSTTGVLAPGGVAIAGYGILSIVNGVTSIGLGIALMAENAGAAGGPKAYQRPSNATNDAQRASVQGQPCATCGNTAPRMNADHVQPLVEEFYQNEGQIDLERMKSVEAVQPQCPTCSNRQGGFLAGFARAMKKLFGL